MLFNDFKKLREIDYFNFDDICLVNWNVLFGRLYFYDFIFVFYSFRNC